MDDLCTAGNIYTLKLVEVALPGLTIFSLTSSTNFN